MASKIPLVTLNDGYKMPILGLGTWQSKSGEVEEVVKAAIDAGYRHFDCAYVYANEFEVGRGINAKLQEGVVKRQDLFVVSKLWNTMHRPDLVVPAIKRTLDNLNLDYLDLYLIHWPMGYQEGDNLFPKDQDGNFIPSEADYVDTWKAMEECVRLGLTKSIGLSNFNSDQIFRILSKSTIKPVVNQVECHPYLNQRMVHQFCQAKDIAVTGYSPLGSVDRPWAKPDDPKLLDDPKIQTIAKKYKKTPAQIVLRWVVQRGIIAIPKTVNKNRLVENMNIFDFELSEEDMNTLYGMHCDGRGFQESPAKKHKYYPFNSEF